MMDSNIQFTSKYEFEMSINDNKFSLTTDDIKVFSKGFRKISLQKKIV